MRYFAEESPKARKGRSLSKAQQQAINRNFSRRWRAYRKQLERIQGRMSQQAWNFFYLGFGRWGLHDAHLLSFTVGDRLDYSTDGRTPFTYNTEKAKVRIVILNRHQNLLCSFHLTDIHRVIFDHPAQDPRWNSNRIDLLETYELTSVNKRYLRLEFLFASGATILVEFARMKFKRQRVRTREPKGLA